MYILNYTNEDRMRVSGYIEDSKGSSLCREIRRNSYNTNLIYVTDIFDGRSECIHKNHLTELRRR